MAKYSDAPFQGITLRKWYGATVKLGSFGTIITFNETQALKVTHDVAIRGPVKIKKIGVLTAATLGKGEELFSLGVDGTATVIGTIVASTTSGQYTIASKTLSKILTAGSYLTLLASTNVCSTGSVAVFIDYIPAYQAGNSKWDA